MPSFTSRRSTPDRLRALHKDDLMADEDSFTQPLSSRRLGLGPKSTTASSPLSRSLALVPSDGGSLLDYFDLPSPPSTPHRPTHSLSYSSLNSFPSPATSPNLGARGRSSTTSTPSSSPPSTPSPSAGNRWPTPSQRIHHHALPSRPRSRSTSSASSSSSTTTSSDLDMAGADGVAPLVRHARRTPYYPPNASRNSDRGRAYMNRGPHFVPNWTPMGSLPRHVQLQIEERMVKFTAL